MNLSFIRRRLAIRTRIARRMIRYRQGAAANIAVFAMTRGGSTLLADMLSSQRGMRMVNEPFLFMEENPAFEIMSRWLRKPPHGFFGDLEEEDLRRVHNYMAAILAGRAPLGVCRHPRFPLRADRTLLKILSAPALLDWLAESFNLQVIRLLRHPASRALSLVRLGWGFPTESFYRKPEFLLGFLSEDQLEFGRRILAGPSRWGIAILDWCIHYHLLVHASRRPAPLVTYEELMVDPAGTCRSLCEHLGLSDFDRIVARLQEPSTSPGGCSSDNLSLIRSGDTQILVRSWQRRVDAAMADEAQEILDRFGVSIYGMGSPLPDHRGAGVPADRPKPPPGDDRWGHPASVGLETEAN